MASAAVDQQHCHHNDLHLESLPLVDLRLLSQSELVSLSGCSSSSSASLPHADTDLFTPKIDRSVFNESAGSRKQTFYRLRLGAPRNNFSPSKPSPAPARLDAEPLDEENVQVVSLLKSLFNIPSEIPSIDIQEGEDLVPVQIEYAGHFSLPSNENNRSETAVLQNIPVGLVTCTGIKRKRGRPRKDEKDNWSIQNAFMEIEKIKTPMICGGANEKVTTNANAGGVSSCSEIKRKRGRPPKNKNSNSTDGSQQRKIESQNECNKDAIMAKNLKEMEVVNVNGEAVDLVALGNANDIVSCSGTKRKRGRPRKDKKDNLSIQKAFTEIEEIKTPMICGSANEKVNTNANEGDVSSCSEIKRKRGRPPKNRNSNSTDGSKQRKVQGQNECNKDAIVAENLKEMEVVNVNGEAVDLVALRNADDFLREELQRRTQGLGTEAELLELLKRLDGEWGTKSEKKRIVDAGNFCNMLPKGWKLMLCVRRRASNAWLACRRYISPNGQQFESCKDVSSYLLSSFGLQDASKQNSVLNADGIDLGVKLMSENLPMTSVSAEHDKQSTLLTLASTEAMQKATTIKCHKCTMTFSQQDDFICHLLSSHQGAATGLGHGASTSKEVLGKDGKYECHFCNQLFEEWHHYNSHLGVHIENYIKNIEGSARVTTLQKGSQPSSVGVTYKGSKMQESIGLVLDSATEDVGVHINLTEEKRDGNSGPLAIHGKEKTFSCQKIEDKHFTSITRETEINYVDKAARDDPKSGGYNIRPGLADATNDVMKKGSSEGHVPSANEKRHDLTDDMRGTLTLVRSSESGLTSHLDNKARVINNKSNLVSTKTKDDREVIVGSQYRDKDPTICFASNDDIKKPSRQKEMEIGPLTLDVSEQIFGYYNNVNKGSRGTIGVSELEKVQGSSGLGQAIGSNDNGLEADIVAGAEQQRAKGCIFVPNVNEQAFTCILKELRQDRGESSVPQPLYKQRGNLTDLNVGYFVDSTHTKPDAGIMTGTGQKSCPHLFSDIEQKFACKINVPGVGSGSVGSGSVHEPKQKKSSLEDLFGVSASEQTYVKNNSNITCTGTVQEGPGLEGFKNAKNNEIMIGFGNHACPSDDAMTEFIWKTDDENVLLADLSETSSQLLQPVHYSTFDVRANKVQGESELFNVNEKFNSTPGFQGLRPGCIEHMEYNFLTAQTSSNSQDSKVSSYDSQMALGFDSSIWFEKEALPLLPKVAGRNQVTSCCSWCGNEFHSEAFDGEADKGLGVHMCPNCTTRFSTNHNFF